VFACPVHPGPAHVTTTMQPGSRSSGEWQLPDELRQMAESGDSEIVDEVLTVFRTDTATRLQSLKAALAAGNAAQVKTQAHSIKGSASQVGAMGMASLCQRIEHEAAERTSAELALWMAELEAGFAEVCRAISAAQDSMR
jgi:HPt (histidine-containing phosphotransfer) domain-containing protein